VGTRIVRLLVVGCVATMIVACGSSSAPVAEQPPAPTTTMLAPEPTEQAATASPAADGPVALRDDITIRKLLETGGGFIRLARDPLSGEILYLNSEGKVFRLDLDAAGGAKGTPVYDLDDIGGASSTTGMAFGPDGALYIVGNEVEETMTRAIIRKGVPDGAGGRTWTTFASTVPYPRSNTQYDHMVNGIVVSPDGKELFVNSGSRTEHGEVQTNNGAFPDLREVPLTSAIFRLPADGSEITLPDDEAALKTEGYLYADGVRNGYDLAFAPNGDLFATENGPDADLPDELNWIREGHHYGFPWRFGVEENPQTRPDYDPATDRRLSDDFVAVDQGLYANDPEFPPAPMAFTDPVINRGPDADQYRDLEGRQQDASDQGQTLATFTPHRSPLGLSFDVDGALGGDWKGDGFVLSWGAAGGSLSDHGEDLLHLDLVKADDGYQATVTQIVRGFERPIDSVLIGKTLYVLEYGGKGGIWEVTLP
jgi:glucose/arabinose dehydrogenase